MKNTQYIFDTLKRDAEPLITTLRELIPEIQITQEDGLTYDTNDQITTICLNFPKPLTDDDDKLLAFSIKAFLIGLYYGKNLPENT